MSKDDGSHRGRSVPSGRLARLGQFGRLAGSVAGGMLAEGARRVANGERPPVRDMLLTPANVARVADRLSHLRGAAMKLGQMANTGDVSTARVSHMDADGRDLLRITGRLRQQGPASDSAILTALPLTIDYE